MSSVSDNDTATGQVLSPAQATASEAALRAEVARGRDAAADIAHDWDDLFRRSAKAVPYLSRAWMGTFVSEGRIRGIPTFVLVRCGDKLVALLALAIRKVAGVRIAEPISTGQPSYLGLLLDPAYPQAARCIAEKIESDGVFDLYYSQDLSSQDTATEQLLRNLRQRGYLYRKVLRNPCPYICLPLHLSRLQF